MNDTIPVIKRDQVLAKFPVRPRHSHKGLFGTVAVIGGANGMTGAPLLAARAALKLGAGSVHVGLLAPHSLTLDLIQPELMLHDAFTATQLPDVNVCAIGCGLGTSATAQKLVYQALSQKAALVVDADALNLIAKHADLQDDLRNRKAATVLTPHPGEAARLLTCSTADIQADRVSAALELSHRFACAAVLKGADSLCVTREGELLVNPTGNPGMSGPGMGDVLTGMIAALIAQGMAADEALRLAVYLHGAAGDALADQHAGIGMTATEVTEWARYLLNTWLRD